MIHHNYYVNFMSTHSLHEWQMHFCSPLQEISLLLLQQYPSPDTPPNQIRNYGDKSHDYHLTDTHMQFESHMTYYPRTKGYIDMSSVQYTRALAIMSLIRSYSPRVM